ncbi:Group II intron maturase-specific domain-containing protein [Vibrio crassostreae]|uniref:Group II intron maturase-specific domain-containing protein n=1 Tax=Vibrio crassostreae TaxID=246167 RepID=A0A822MYN1_9VIBR|nr:Group II intron maturase-specific domain-containing protein [Vibrio crassostreae]CAK1714621.1 Group II intron maturase-specific domain-containing protein [Vibrio crassostreae]CAK1722923.1 Group II intron maturase-specific domain-containing protein [Vibrio crassostreae]CAK1723343.1 Group II intron maturase-specific domain-containing protein [Vibrio crassostreae]CAK1724426.1 Group II intron maturase-specific domain-containing protein [Vibrio crassostreae]
MITPYVTVVYVTKHELPQLNKPLTATSYSHSPFLPFIDVTFKLSFLGNLRELIKKHATTPMNDLIKILVPKLKGWASYYRHCVAKRTFNYVSH